MMTAEAIKPSKVTAFPANGVNAPGSKAVPKFTFGLPDDDGPELQLLKTSLKAEDHPPVSTGSDQSGKPKIIFWVGRGKTGKTTGIRWQAERAVRNDTVMLMADMDPTNDTFSKYVGNVARPPEASDPILALKWLDRLLQYALEQKTTLLVDLGGGDTTLRRLVEDLPDLVRAIEAAGFAVILFHAIGPQEEDLSPLATLEGLGFHPTCTAIVLNQGLIEIGATPDTAFARVFRHSAFRAAVARGAVVIWMPRLQAAEQVEIRRLHFQGAVDGESGQGKTPLGPFDRQRVANWLRHMEENFSGIASWLP
jgi:hypothetical protein